jgi:hypothetical protein
VFWTVVAWLLIAFWILFVGLAAGREINLRIWRKRCRERLEDDHIHLCRLRPGHIERHYSRERHGGTALETWWREGTHEYATE